MPDYKTSLVTTFDTAEFDALWAEGKRTVLANFPFHLFANCKTEPEKYAFFLGIYSKFMTEGIVWKSVLDGKTVAINAGRIIDDPKKGRLIEWNAALLGYQPDGTRAWLTADWATVERDRFWAELGVKGWRQLVFDKDNSNGIVRHYKQNKATEEAKGDKVEMTDPKEDLIVGGRISIDVTKED